MVSQPPISLSNSGALFALQGIAASMTPAARKNAL